MPLVLHSMKKAFVIICTHSSDGMRLCGWRQYSGALPSNVQEVFTFVDLVPLFRRLGCDILEGHLHLIKLNLMEVRSYSGVLRYCLN